VQPYFVLPYRVGHVSSLFISCSFASRISLPSAKTQTLWACILIILLCSKPIWLATAHNAGRAPTATGGVPPGMSDVQCITRWRGQIALNSALVGFVAAIHQALQSQSWLVAFKEYHTCSSAHDG
jgi:hypothetical protein